MRSPRATPRCARAAPKAPESASSSAMGQRRVEVVDRDGIGHSGAPWPRTWPGRSRARARCRRAGPRRSGPATGARRRRWRPCRGQALQACRERRRRVVGLALAAPRLEQVVGRPCLAQLGVGQPDREDGVVAEGVLEDGVHARVVVPAPQRHVERLAVGADALVLGRALVADVRAADAALGDPDRLALRARRGGRGPPRASPTAPGSLAAPPRLEYWCWAKTPALQTTSSGRPSKNSEIEVPYLRAFLRPASSPTTICWPGLQLLAHRAGELGVDGGRQRLRGALALLALRADEERAVGLVPRAPPVDVDALALGQVLQRADQLLVALEALGGDRARARADAVALAAVGAPPRPIRARRRRRPSSRSRCPPAAGSGSRAACRGCRCTGGRAASRACSRRRPWSSRSGRRAWAAARPSRRRGGRAAA